MGPYRGSHTHLQVLRVLQQPLRHSSVLHVNHYLLPVCTLIPVKKKRTHLQVLQVLQQPLRHSSVLHLNHYLLPVFEHRPVHLRDRGSIRLY